MSDAEVDKTTLRLERLIPLPPEILFALWTEPAQLLKWWAPEGYEPSVDALDTRPGGRWRTILRRPDGSTLATSGVYRIVEPPHRLAFTWAWEDASGARGHETEVTVDFEPAPVAPASCWCNGASRASSRATITPSAGRRASTG
jgi:uncharacterized protein YndB with AHSA1/START domain